MKNFFELKPGKKFKPTCGRCYRQYDYIDPETKMCASCEAKQIREEYDRIQAQKAEAYYFR